MASYRKALEVEPSAEIHNNLGVTQTSRGNLEGAIASYKEAVRMRPNCWQAHNNLGGALHRQGKIEEAMACYLKALEIELSLAEAQNNIALVLAGQGKLGDATQPISGRRSRLC